MKRLIPCVLLAAILACPAQQTPQQLVTAAGSFRDLSQRDMDVVKTYLMTVIALGTTPTPASLVTSAAAFRQLSSTDLQVIQTYLLSQISVAGGGTNVISITAAAGGAAVNAAVTNALPGTIIQLGPGYYTNQSIRLPGAVSLVGAGRGKTVLYFTNQGGFSATAGWLMASNGNTVANLTIAPVPDGDWKDYAPVITCDNATNVIFSGVEVIGHSDVGVWFNTSDATFIDCKFDTGFDTWTDANGASSAGTGRLRFFSCEFFGHLQGFPEESAADLRFILFSSGSSTNVVLTGCSMLMSNTPTAASGGSAIMIDGPVYIGSTTVSFQRTNTNPNVFVAAGGAVINGHPYPDYLCGSVTFLGDATNAPISGAFMQSADATGYRRWAPNTNSPGPFTITSSYGFGTTGSTNALTAQFNYANLQYATNCGWGVLASNATAGTTLTLKGYEQFVITAGATAVTLGDATTNLGHHISITCGSAGTNAINTVSSQKIAGATKWTNTAIFTCTQLISDGANWQICGTRGN